MNIIQNHSSVSAAQIGHMAAKLLQKNPAQIRPLCGLMREYNIKAIIQLPADKLPEFAERLIAMGAEPMTGKEWGLC